MRCAAEGELMTNTHQNSASPQDPIRPSGARRMNLQMLTMLDQADRFTGLPRGTAKPLRVLAAFQEAEPYLGLPAHAFKLISWLVRMTQPQDWEVGSRPIAWPSSRHQQEFLGLSSARVKSLNRVLFEAGIFVMRDNEQGKRYGRRGPDGRILEAFGFDLSPLAQQYDEFVRIAAAAKVERERMKDLRRRVTLARRAIRQIGEELTALDRLPTDWPKMVADVASLVVTAKRAEGSEALSLIVHAIERRKSEADERIKAIREAVKKDPEGPENEPHTTTTNLTMNLKDTVIASEESSRAERPVPKPLTSAPAATPETELRLKPAQLVDLAPRLRGFVRSDNPTWPDIVDAADWLRGELGVSRPLWVEACRLMGREYAAVAIAIVSTKGAGHFHRGAGGYFAGMVRKAEKGELHLDRTLWALRAAKWGQPRQAGKERLVN
jgi:replication initiation protein RepC